jgi:triosephosphate isomerase
MIIVNFKRYPEASGDKAVTLVKICLQIQQETGVTIIPVPQAKDLAACTAVGIKCWSQRFEANESVQKGCRNI